MGAAHRSTRRRRVLLFRWYHYRHKHQSPDHRQLQCTSHCSQEADKKPCKLLEIIAWHCKKARESKGTNTLLSVTRNLVGKDSQMILKMGPCLMLKQKTRKRIPAPPCPQYPSLCDPGELSFLTFKSDDQFNPQYASKNIEAGYRCFSTTGDLNTASSERWMK